MQQRSAIASLIAAAALMAGATVHAAGPASPQVQSPAATEASPAGDAAVTSQVKAALLEDKQLSAQKIDVSTNDGVVVLKGSIPNAEAAQQAIQVTSGVPGVKDVKNELKLGK